MCTWSNVPGAELDWMLNSGPTMGANTGPQFDHTLATPKGHYVYVETSAEYVRDSRLNDGMTARLVSEPTNNWSDSPMCIHFWYHMYGNVGVILLLHIVVFITQRPLNCSNMYMQTTGSLNVYKFTSTDGDKTRLWSLSGEQGNEWRLGSAPYSSGGVHQIMFEAVVMSGGQGNTVRETIYTKTQKKQHID